MTARPSSPRRPRSGPQRDGKVAEYAEGQKNAPDASSEAQQRFELWFARRLGPVRKDKVDVGYMKLTRKRRRLELPPNANDRLHWRVKAPWIAEWRKAGGDAAIAQRLPALERVRISAVIYRSHLGRADADGDLARLKPLVDGLVDAGVVPDDRRKFVEYGPVIEHRATNEPGILLIVEALPAPQRAAAPSAACQCCYAERYGRTCRCARDEIQPCGACVIHCMRNGCKCEPHSYAANEQGEGGTDA